MIIQGQVGVPTIKQTAGNPNVPQGYLAELFVSELTPVYYSLVKAGRVFFVTLTAGNPTAFTGGAAGTPLIGIMNPALSGYDIVVLHTRIGVRTTGTAAATTDYNWYGGPSVLPTGTATQPTNAYSMQTTGSVARCFVNAAMTSSTAINPICPVASLGATTNTAGLVVFPALDATSGVVVASPGNLIALGSSSTMTAASLDTTVIWAEIPA